MDCRDARVHRQHLRFCLNCPNYFEKSPAPTGLLSSRQSPSSPHRLSSRALTEILQFLRKKTSFHKIVAINAFSSLGRKISNTGKNNVFSCSPSVQACLYHYEEEEEEGSWFGITKEEAFKSPMPPSSSSLHNSIKPPKLSPFSSTTSPEVNRIIHNLHTITSSSSLLPLLSSILLHGLHLNSSISSSFISLSLSLLSPRPAILLFSLLPRPPPFVCNTLMLSLLPFRTSAPLLLFHQMHFSSLPPNHHTFPILLKSISLLRFFHSGISLHTHILKLGFLPDPYISSSLLHFYTLFSHNSALQLFDELPHRDVVSWSTLIAGLARAGRPADALIVFERMHFAEVTPNRVTMVSALAACAAHGRALDFGEWIHRQAVRSGWELNVVLGTALVDMYCKHGCVDSGLEVFLRMPCRSVFTWNSLIQGFAFVKGGLRALEWFSKMEEEGISPDSVTLVGVLTACSHSGLVEPGRRIFDMVIRGKFGFEAGIKHYGCMVDLYGRAGMLDSAVECIRGMPFEPNVVIYGSLLAGSRAGKEMNLSEFAARRLVELQPDNAAHYVLLSNLYVEMGRWREAEEVRRSMKVGSLRKESGWALTECDDIWKREYVKEAV